MINFICTHSSLGGKCGICGDSYSGPRDHEIGGKYATNTIVRNYISDSLIDVKILVSYRINQLEENYTRLTILVSFYS